MNQNNNNGPPSQPTSSFGNFQMNGGNGNNQPAAFQTKAPPPNFQQKVPGGEYLNRKRASVFQKVDLKAISNVEIPSYPKTLQ